VPVRHRVWCVSVVARADGIVVGLMRHYLPQAFAEPTAIDTRRRGPLINPVAKLGGGG